MVLAKSSTTACILLIVFLCAAWLSSARLHPAAAQLDGIWSTKASTAGVATATVNNNNKEKRVDVINGMSSKKVSVKKGKSKNGDASSSRSSGTKRSFSRTRFSDEVGGGFVAFTADYHSPRHHPPKNNK